MCVCVRERERENGIRVCGLVIRERSIRNCSSVPSRGSTFGKKESGLELKTTIFHYASLTFQSLVDICDSRLTKFRGPSLILTIRPCTIIERKYNKLLLKKNKWVY